ncbi:hypothetical protein [Calothrix sp. UHCC 0171]|nr:hypothetical protein [Calothrix sp. UHCC 0171]MEA5572062.1 hypothetical protein [Calothrix sp. UHCC 0171]
MVNYSDEQNPHPGILKVVVERPELPFSRSLHFQQKISAQMVLLFTYFW